MAASAQSPAPATLNVDHVAHFVPDIDAASAELARLGFCLTPFSSQSHRLQPDGPLTPAGTGNRCVMLEQGYLEFLTPTADTPIADQLRQAIRRYVGVHLIAFGTSDANRDHARLAKAGFGPLAPVALQRTVETETGSDTARFSVVRVPPAVMPEGRIQFCQHHTPRLLWQPRWMRHPNGLQGLAGVLLCVDSPEETARRYGRYTGLAARRWSDCWRLDTARGYLAFLTGEQFRVRFDHAPPALPWIAGYVLTSGDLGATRAYLRPAESQGKDGARLRITLASALGGIAIVVDARSAADGF